MKMNYWVIPGKPVPKLLSDNEIASKIFDSVKLVTSYSYSDMNVSSRDRSLVLARQLTFYFLRKYTTYSLERIGNLFGRDHTTIIHGVRTVNNLLYTGYNSAVAWEKDIESILNKQSININKYGRDKRKGFQ